MDTQERDGPRPEKRRPERETLTLRVPAHEDLLRSLPSSLDIAPARNALKVLWSERNAFDIKRRSMSQLGGSSGRLNRETAERIWEKLTKGKAP